ncbi:MAG TPA: hypothetical protein VGS57_14215 [Thermoanaerobaculia bacterium]|jgi:hypothetical protein|nr:hypothetical protein [Thermoanaerobaculia bacterium]
MRRALLALSLLLFAWGCDNGPTDPTRTQSLTGTLARSGFTITTLSMHSAGNLRVTAVDLATVAADGTTSAANGGITFTTGTGNTTTCTAAGNFGLIKGSVLSLGLNKGDYCLKLTEPTLIAEGSSLRYDIQLEITD